MSLMPAMTVHTPSVERSEATSRVRVFDTTLRDGEQAPGCSMSPPQKLEVARQLARLGVDVIEAGFPAASAGELEAVTTIATIVGVANGPTICGLARANVRDIEVCAAAITPAVRRRIHTFIATSDIHMQRKLRASREDVLERVKAAVQCARSIVDDVEFSPEDATRSDPAFLDDVLQVALDAGATTLNIPDTVGYSTPDEYGRLIERVCQLACRYPDVVVSTHCHNDLGLAVANSLAGVRAGARQVECTINGLGERAGNASLEEIVMALRTRPSVFGCGTSVDARELMRSSQLVAKSTGVPVPPNKAIVGANAFAHESGIHQDGMLKDPATYEIMTPQSVGLDGTRLVLGKHSGRNALRARLESLGHKLADDALTSAFSRFKTMSDAVGEINDEMLISIIDAPTRPRTLADKIWEAHVVRAASPATPAVLYVDLHIVHEVTSAQAFAELSRRGLRVRHPGRTIATMDHSTPTQTEVAGATGLPVLDDQARIQLEQLARNCEASGIPLYPLYHERQGIVHVIGPELGLTQPGMTIVCGDSHTSTHGAFGAMAFGIGTSQVAHVLATQCVLHDCPKSMQVRVEGRLGPGVSAKDIILAIIAKIGVAGATGHVIEYCGSTITSLSMDERMTICNMSIEAGARAGMIAPDDVTFDYLAGRPHAPSGPAWPAALGRWRLLRSDDDATFSKHVSIDATSVEPMMTFGTNPGMAIAISGRVPTLDTLATVQDRNALAKALDYMSLAPGQRLAGVPIGAVFLGSCTNSRLSDLRAAAAVLRGARVAAGVRMLVVPGSRAVKRAAEAEGLDRVFLDAGAEWREPGCSMCIAMNGDQLRPGELAVSTSNRNFEGRQGPGGRTLLASPITAAACAITGVVTDPRPFIERSPH
jgi:3-isopropylmalate/(R)-2-methylmalate dehydratase large subunit